MKGRNRYKSLTPTLVISDRKWYDWYVFKTYPRRSLQVWFNSHLCLITAKSGDKKKPILYCVSIALYTLHAFYALYHPHVFFTDLGNGYGFKVPEAYYLDGSSVNY